MKKQKGITLITLVITIVLMCIIAGVATYSGLETVASAKVTTFKAELEMIQAKVNVIYEKRKTSDNEKQYYNNLGQDINFINEQTLLQVLGGTSKEGFRYFSKEDLSLLELADIKQDVIINFDTCEVISITGIEIDNVKYYKLKDLPNYNWYKVEHVNKNMVAKEFIIEQTKLSDSYRITIKDSNGKDINNGSLSYKLHNNENWILNGNNMSFIVRELGIYDVRYTDTSGNSRIEQFAINCELIVDEDGNSIPVPIGFMHVEGTKDTGFVIKDVSMEDENNPTITNGNEYVWIPCNIDGKEENVKYDRYAYSVVNFPQNKDEETGIIRWKVTGYQQNEMIENSIPVESNSVRKYGGFYIGRYKVGVTGDTTLITTSDGSEEWTGYSKADPVIKKDTQVWNYVTRNKAIRIAENMYNKSSIVVSRLCSSYAWDTVLKYIEIRNPNYITMTTKVEGGNITGTTNSVNNIYDTLNSVYEFTTETCINTDTNSELAVARGGMYGAAQRSTLGTLEYNNANISFRTTLFLRP